MCTFAGSLLLDSKVVIWAQLSCPLLAWRHLPSDMVSGMSRHPRQVIPWPEHHMCAPWVAWRGAQH